MLQFEVLPSGVSTKLDPPCLVGVACFLNLFPQLKGMFGMGARTNEVALMVGLYGVSHASTKNKKMQREGEGK